MLHDFMGLGVAWFRIYLPLLSLFLGSGETLEILPIARMLIVSME